MERGENNRVTKRKMERKHAPPIDLALKSIAMWVMGPFTNYNLILKYYFFLWGNYNPGDLSLSLKMMLFKSSDYVLGHKRKKRNQSVLFIIIIYS